MLTLNDKVSIYSTYRLSEMPAELAESVRNVMREDGYLETDSEGYVNTFSPFDDMDPDFGWLREEYVRAVLNEGNNG